MPLMDAHGVVSKGDGPLRIPRILTLSKNQMGAIAGIPDLDFILANGITAAGNVGLLHYIGLPVKAIQFRRYTIGQ